MKTQTTKPGWGIVALVSLVAATTLEGSLIITAISVALFTFSAWKGGYMDTSTGSVTVNEKGGTL